MIFIFLITAVVYFYNMGGGGGARFRKVLIYVCRQRGLIGLADRAAPGGEGQDERAHLQLGIPLLLPRAPGTEDVPRGQRCLCEKFDQSHRAAAAQRDPQEEIGALVSHLAGNLVLVGDREWLH